MGGTGIEAGSIGVDRLEQWLAGGGRIALDRFTGCASDVIGVMDPAYVIRYVNRTAPGLSRESVVGQSAFNLIPPSETQVARDAFDQVLSSGTPARFEITFGNDQGVIVFVVRVYPILDDGQVIGAFTVNTDATEERRESVDRDRFFSLSLDMLIVVTPQGVLRRVNPAFGASLGYAVSEIIGHPFANYLHPGDVDRTLRAYQRVLAGDNVDVFENRYRRRDGAFRVFSWRATVDPITGDVYAVARDVTEHRSMEAQLRHAQKMEAVGQLAGGVSHDFNNLMLAILANVELALLPDSSRLDVIDHLQEIANAGKRAVELTKQLLAFSRRQKLDRAPVDLNAMLQGLMKLLGRLLPENIVIEARLGKDLPSVNADPTQLEQIAINLCVNARDAMETGGTLTLETYDIVIGPTDCEQKPWARPGHFVCLSVTDTGIGMAPDVRDRAFEPFFTTKSDRSGTGLGLSTVYGIVEQHDGLVDLVSDLGQGTTFRVFLPADERPALARPARQEVRRGPGGQATILLAEDDDFVRKPLLRILTGAGYRALAASNGRQAIELLTHHLGEVDLVLLDIVMPEVDGPEAWRKMRELHPTLRVVFMSGHADVRFRKRLPPDAEILDKPFSSEELLRRIRQKLEPAAGSRMP